MVVVKLKINNQQYADKTDDELSNFTGTVLEKGVGNASYPDIQVELLSLAEQYVIFSNAVKISKTDGGKDRTKATKYARKEILKRHIAVTDKLAVLAPSQPDPEAYITDLGYEPAKKPTRRTGIIKPPVVKSWRSGGKNAVRGVVSFVIKAEDPLEIRAVVGKYSLDGGITWEPEFVSVKLIFDLAGQPSGKNVIYQFKFLATNNRESYWSGNVEVGVY